MRLAGRTLVAGSALLSALLAQAAAAQQTAPDTAAADTVVTTTVAADGGGEEAERFHASPPLAPDHWAVRAAARAEALGLAPGYLPAQRTVPRAAVAAALRQAVELAPERMPAMTRVAGGWLARFQEEFPEYRDGAQTSGFRPLGGALGVEARSLQGRLSPARGVFAPRQDPVPLPDDQGVGAAARLAFAAGRHLSGAAEPRLAEGGADVPRWEVTAGAGALALSAGEQPVGYGPAAGGGVVLGANAPLFRVQLETTRPVRLPGAFRALGQLSFQTFGTRLTEARHRGDPWMWGARLGVRPHPRVTLGINRAAVFGGDSVAMPTTVRNVASMLLGLLSGEFENQVVSVEGRLRLPTERVLPLSLYLEWGSEDAAGSWRDVPGIVAGAYVPAVPGAPRLALGAEYATFKVFCCGNPPWYFHLGHPGNWAARGEPLGHPLGGDGRELLGYADADLLDGRLRLGARAFLRHRPDEGYETPERAGNLFGPARFGDSRGGAAQAALRAFGAWELRLIAEGEAGGGWSERQLRTSLSWLF